MSGGPPHHPHNRQVPPANTAWNHLQGFQVPNFFPRQPQLAHMSNESMIHHHNLLNDMLKNDSPFPRDCVDLSLTRSDNQNGGPPQSPISLSVRDTNKINSMPFNELEVHTVEHSKSSTSTIKPTGSGLKVPGSSYGSSALPYSSIPGKSTSPGVISLSPYHKSSSTSPKLQTSGHLAATVDMLASGLIEPNFLLPTTNTDLTSTSASSVAANPLIMTSSSLQTNPGLKAFGQGLYPVSPGLLGSSFGTKPLAPIPNSSGMVLSSHSPQPEISKNLKRATSRVDSILERLNPSTTAENIINKFERKSEELIITKKTDTTEKLEQTASDKSRLIIQHSSNFDENSNSNSINNIPTMSNNDDNISITGNEDSLDSTKSRRKRKPSKTIKVPKEEEKVEPSITLEKVIEPSDPIQKDVPENPIESESAKDPITLVGKILEGTTVPDSQQSTDELESLLPEKPSRKTSSESETIDDIAAMVQEGLKEKQMRKVDKVDTVEETKLLEQPPETIIDIPKSEEKVIEPPATIPETTNVPPKKENTHFVEVENRLEEMFAGIEDSSDPLKADALNITNTNLDDVDNSNLEDIEDTKMEEDPLEKLEDPIHVVDSSPEVVSSVSASSVTGSASGSVTVPDTPTKEVINKSSPKKAKRKAPTSSKSSETSESKAKISKVNNKTPTKKPMKQTQSNCKVDSTKDIYSYDSGSNASSSKSRGPFIQIRGPRDSPVSVNVVNTSQNDEDGERKQYKIKKYHDDTEYRHKVRSKGLHCSTLSNKYDAQTRDASWICAFCKRGPHTSDFSGLSANQRYIPPGDLFGPYFITKQCADYEKLLEDPLDKQFKSKKITKLLENNPLLKMQSSKKSKKKSLEPESNMYLGITDTGNKTFEIWAHEDCIVWSPGTYLVGPKIVGLEEAVWSSCAVSCNHCQKTGANIFCLKRGCLNATHIDCARVSGWMLLENSFKAYCQDHRVP